MRIRLQSETEDEYKIKEGVWRRKKYFILTLFLFASIVIVVSTFLNFTKYHGAQNYIFEMLAKIGIFGIDIYFTIIFIKLLKFHTNSGRESYRITSTKLKRCCCFTLPN